MRRGAVMTAGALLAASAALGLLLSQPGDRSPFDQACSREDERAAPLSHAVAVIVPRDGMAPLPWIRRPAGLWGAPPAPCLGLAGCCLPFVTSHAEHTPVWPEGERHDLLALHCLLTV